MKSLICNHCGEIVDTRNFYNDSDLAKFLVETVARSKTTLDVGIIVKGFIKANPNLIERHDIRENLEVKGTS